MVVVDSCVLILLSEVGKLSLLRYFKEVLITPEIYKETTEKDRPGASEIEKACKDWIGIERVKLNKTESISELNGMERADLSIIMLAKSRGDILLSNSRTLIQIAKIKGVECYWLTTFLLKLVKNGKIGKEDAKDIIFDLVENGMRLRIEVYAAILKKD